MPRLAIEGGKPVRKEFLPYGRHAVHAADIRAVRDVLLSDHLAQGPACRRYEQAFAQRVRAKYAVALSSGTAALHAAVHTLRLRPNDEVIVPPMTFAATANAVLYCGGRPVFGDVDPATGLLDQSALLRKITKRTRAVIPVHYAGHPCDLPGLRRICSGNRLRLVVDACHALGSHDARGPVGAHDGLCVFSTHPVKHITTGEGGVVTTTRKDLYERLMRFRTHGIRRRESVSRRVGGWFYEMVDLGFNYRLSDIGCALGLSQLSRLEEKVARRRALARRYYEQLAGSDYIDTIPEPDGTQSAYHIFPVLLRLERFRATKKRIFAALRAENIGVQVHYIPVYLHPYYRRELGAGKGLCPNAERFYEREITLPLFPTMTRGDQNDVLRALDKVYRCLRR